MRGLFKTKKCAITALRLAAREQSRNLKAAPAAKHQAGLFAPVLRVHHIVTIPMKSISKFIFRAIAFCLAASAAHAQTATLNISGRITNTPCTISVGNVTMGDVPISEFATSFWAPEKYTKSFSVTLGGCELSTLNTASLKFTGTTAGDNTTLALKTGTGAAQGFGVSIFTNDMTHLGANYQVRVDGGASYPFNISTGKKTFDFKASYVKLSSSGVLKPGTANATATITLTYS